MLNGDTLDEKARALENQMRLRIFMMPSGYPNNLYPQANVFLKEQAIALSKAGAEVIVLNVAQKTIRNILDKTPPKIQVKEYEGVTEYSIWVYTFKTEKLKGIYIETCKSAMAKLYRYACVKRGVPDLIYAHFAFYAGLIAREIVSNDNIPIVTQEHYSYLMNEKISADMVDIERTALNVSDSFLCVSQNLKQQLIKHLHLVDDGKLVVIENMLNNDFSYAAPIKKDRFCFLAIGNLNKRKRFDLLINAFIYAFSVDEDVELRIGGNGEEKNKLEKLIHEAKREHQILLLGALSRKEVIEQNQYCDCFALVSEKETFGIVYREALAIGRPIISSDHGGFDGVFDDRDGILIKDCSIENVGSAFRTMRNQYALYNCKDISQRCLKKYSSEIISRKLMHHFETTIKGRIK